MSAVDRQSLHHRLDALIDRRDELLGGRSALDTSIERYHPSLLDDDMDPEHPADLLYISIMQFASDLAGPCLREEVAPAYASDGADQRRSLRWILTLLVSVFPVRSGGPGSCFRALRVQDVSRALRAVDAGSAPPIFRVAGSKHEPDLVSRHQLMAVALLVHAKAQSMAAGTSTQADSNTILVASAYKVNRRTVEGWQSDLKKVAAGEEPSSLGAMFVADVLRNAPNLGPMQIAHMIFGTTIDGPRTLEEAGERYSRLLARRTGHP